MGGGNYDGDVATRARSSKRDVFTYQGHTTTAAQASQARSVHPELDPNGKMRECLNETPIVVAMDVTRSRGDDSRVIYEKLPLFIGQIELKAYVKGAGISFCAIGDADSDRAPLQVGQFEADNRLDAVLSKIWLEEGGGGTGQESYELAAYFYAHHTKLQAYDEGRKGFFFFLGDEGFYPQVSKSQIHRFLGRDVPEDVPAAQAFAELQKRFHTFLIYPQKTVAERKQDIDAEIKKRVEAAGGRYEGVDVRASLIWNNRNDLDLHVIAPSGEHIYYGHKKAACGGWLDVDMNVSGETTKPVENVQWRRGGAPPGKYKISVHNYRFHEDDGAPTQFRVELEVNGRMQHFDHVISPRGETGPASEIVIAEFTYDPSQRQAPPPPDAAYGQYSDEVILKQWGSVIPPEHILQIEDPKAIIDVMLGALAIVGGGGDLDSYLTDMKGRDQTDLRQDQALRTLGGLAGAFARSRAATSGTLPDGGGPRRGSGSQRL
jgi:hypothetical protein